MKGLFTPRADELMFALLQNYYHTHVHIYTESYVSVDNETVTESRVTDKLPTTWANYIQMMTINIEVFSKRDIIRTYY